MKPNPHPYIVVGWRSTPGSFCKGMSGKSRSILKEHSSGIAPQYKECTQGNISMQCKSAHICMKKGV
jgi:hypothetical protein